ncbi:MAG: hypothetical protein KAT77_04530 [Nanoarchaeota archaeon]|nr:hypothetical protein [Nanoarchaeota archaeon]
MTVGISFTNSLEAIVVTDSRVSSYGRKSDSVEKVGKFEHEKYHGVIYGSGGGNIIRGVIENLDKVQGRDLEEFVEDIHQREKRRENKFEEDYLKRQKTEIQKKAKLITNPDEKKEYIKQETARLIQNFEQSKKDPQYTTSFILTAFDKESKKIRHFAISAQGYNELFQDHIETGSGTDGADSYFSTKLQGIDSKKLESKDLAFFAINAYSFSNINQGVGGRPKIVQITDEEVKMIDSEKTNVLMNLSGAHLSEHPEGYSNQATRDHMGQTLNGNPNYQKIADVLKLNQDTLKTTAIPYSSWQERSNLKRFGNGNSEKKP